MTKIRLKTFHIACLLLVCSWSASVNSKSNSHSNGNSTKGIIRYQQNFETKLNHLVVDNVGSRVSFDNILQCAASSNKLSSCYQTYCRLSTPFFQLLRLQSVSLDSSHGNLTTVGKIMEIFSRGSWLQRDKLIKKCASHSTGGVSIVTHDERVIFR